MSILDFSVDYLYVSRRLHLNPGFVATTHGKSIVDFDLSERLSEKRRHSHYMTGG
jgi:hypothetical protein